MPRTVIQARHTPGLAEKGRFNSARWIWGEGWGRLDRGEDTSLGLPTRGSLRGQGEKRVPDRGKGERAALCRSVEWRAGCRAGSVLGQGSWVQILWEPRLSPQVTGSCWRIRMVLSVLQKDLPKGPVEDAQRRASRRQGKQLTGYCHIQGKNDYKLFR